MDLSSFHLRGFSLGGIETLVTVPQWSLAIDVGRGRSPALKASHIALTHTHMDHAGGLPYVLALRQLYRMKPPTIYVPAQMAARVAEMIAAWDRLQRFESQYTLIPAQPGERYKLARGLFLEPFRTYHPVPSCGYSVIRVVDKLKPEYHGRPGPELGRLRREGVAITAPLEARLLSVTGDTLAEVLDKQPQILDSEVLMLECTFLDASKPYEAARDGGHVHLDDLIPRAELFAGRTLILSHFSQIYTLERAAELLRPLAEAISPALYAFPMAPEQEAIGPIGATGASGASGAIGSPEAGQR